MKLKDEFIAYVTKEQTLLVAAGNASFHGLVRGNETLGAILELLKEDRSEEELVQEMRRKYEAPENVIANDVRKVIDTLRQIGALDE